jgi:hypothetical protein
MDKQRASSHVMKGLVCWRRGDSASVPLRDGSIHTKYAQRGISCVCEGEGREGDKEISYLVVFLLSVNNINTFPSIYVENPFVSCLQVYLYDVFSRPHKSNQEFR